MTRPPQQQCRTSLREICQHNNHNNSLIISHSKKPEMTKRMSARILFREKLKSISHRKPPKFLQDEGDGGMIDPSQIEPWNPAHKLSFLRLLDLQPKSGQGGHIVIPGAYTRPVVQLERLDDDFVVSSKFSPQKNSHGSCRRSSSFPKVEETGDPDPDEIWINSDSEEDDLDLELVCCPLDIPEIYEQITKKPCPAPPPASDLVNDEKFQQRSSSSSSESGYDSPTTLGSRVSSPMTNVGPRFLYKNTKSVIDTALSASDDWTPPYTTTFPNSCSDDDDCVIIDEILNPVSKNFTHPFCENVQTPFSVKKGLLYDHNNFCGTGRKLIS